MVYASLPRQNRPRRSRRFGRQLLFLVVAIVLGIVVWQIFSRQDTETSDSNQSNNTNGSETKPFDAAAYSVSDPASPWIVVNKQRPLAPLDYAPADLAVPNVKLKTKAGNMETQLRQEAATALEQLVQGAKADNLELMFISGYRSYNFQKSLFDYYVRTDGREIAEQTSAHAGHSEHQTGWAADVGAASRECEIEICFGDMPEGEWIATHAHEYGFIIRYTKDDTAVTGYNYEPWHLRYVGKPLAAELHKQNIQTLEEFFGLPDAPNY